MVGSSSLESILASLDTAPWSGRVFRFMLGDSPLDRENSHGARWNPPDIAAIYTCLEESTCIDEVEYNLAQQPRPIKPGLRKTPYEIEVALTSTVDLHVVLPSLKPIGIGSAQLFSRFLVKVE